MANGEGARYEWLMDYDWLLQLLHAVTSVRTPTVPRLRAAIHMLLSIQIDRTIASETMLVNCSRRCSLPARRSVPARSTTTVSANRVRAITGGPTATLDRRTSLLMLPSVLLFPPLLLAGDCGCAEAAAAEPSSKLPSRPPAGVAERSKPAAGACPELGSPGDPNQKVCF